jgi:HEPN/RES N-terminal domain 1
LSGYIAAKGTAVVCDYCGLDPQDSDHRCIPFDDPMDVNGEGINWAYASADSENIPYESAEGGYAFAVYDTQDLVTNGVCLSADQDVIADVIRALPDESWCRKHFWSLSLGDALSAGWHEFVERVTFQTRYLFNTPERPEPPDEQPSPDDPFVDSFGDREFEIEFDYQEDIPVSEMLFAIGRVVSRLNLFRILAIGDTFFRARMHNKGRMLVGPRDLGPPLRE